MGDSGARQRRWALGGLVFYALAVGVVLLAPVSYSGIVNALSDWSARTLGLGWFGSGWVEFAANVLMFAPLGFLLTLLLPHRWQGVVLAVTLSVAAEIVQAVIPSRQPSFRDILANALGAGIGAVLALCVVRWRRSPTRSAQPLDGARGDVSEL